MKKLTIDRKIWLRGEGSVRSKLLRPEDQKRCCIGIYLESCSVPKETLLNKGTYYGIAQWVSFSRKRRPGCTATWLRLSTLPTMTRRSQRKNASRS